MLGFQTLLRGCNSQLSGTEIKFNDVDYGFGWQNSMPLFWAELKTVEKAFLAIGIITGSSLLLSAFGLCG